MTTVEQVKIEGLRELQAQLRALDGESQKKLRVVLNKAAQLVVDDARPRVPLGPGKNGHARDTLKAMSSQREVTVRGGGRKAPYYPWLDFGGTVGRGRTGRGGVESARGRADQGTAGSVRRAVLLKGRYIYPSWDRKRDEAIEVLHAALIDLATEVGLIVD